MPPYNHTLITLLTEEKDFYPGNPEPSFHAVIRKSRSQDKYPIDRLWLFYPNEFSDEHSQRFLKLKLKNIKKEFSNCHSIVSSLTQEKILKDPVQR